MARNSFCQRSLNWKGKAKNNPFQAMSAFAFDEVLLRLSFEILYPLVVTKPILRFRT
jgi:hypothetical protein